jgi:hypothetical protein
MRLIGTIVSWAVLITAALPPIALAILKSPSWRYAPLERPGVIPLAFIAIYGSAVPILLAAITLVLFFKSRLMPKQVWPAKVGFLFALLYILFQFAECMARR